MTEVAKINLSAGSLQTVQVDGKPHVVLKPAIEALGLDWKNQHEKLKSRSWACMVQRTMQLPGDTQARQVTVVPVRTFLMLLATINENRVAEEIRPTLVAFQSETADAIEAYWVQGGAINPRANEEQLDSLISRAERQAGVLRALSGIVDPVWLETKGRMLAARALAEEPELDPLDAPLYVPDFLKSKGLRQAQIQSEQSWFGRRISMAYTLRTGKRPSKRWADLPDGTVRETNAWTARELPLFELVWTNDYRDRFRDL